MSVTLSELDFESQIRSLAQRSGIKVANVESGKAELEFGFGEGDNRTAQTVWIKPYDGIWEFSCLSFVREKDEDEFPKFVLAYALKQNSKNYRGFWCLKRFPNSGNTYLEYMDNHNASLLNPEEFSKVCWNTAQRVDQFERAIRSDG